MNQAAHSTDHVLKVELELHVDRQPLTGLVRSAGGVEHAFVGWLGFLGVLEWLQARSDVDTQRKD